MLLMLVNRYVWENEAWILGMAKSVVLLRQRSVCGSRTRSTVSAIRSRTCEAELYSDGKSTRLTASLLIFPNSLGIGRCCDYI